MLRIVDLKPMQLAVSPLTAEDQKQAVISGLASQDDRHWADAVLAAIPHAVREAMATSILSLEEQSPGALYERDSEPVQVFVSLTDKRIAGYGIFLHETDGDHEAIITLGFDLSGNEVFRDRFSI